jgi:hypothetical protein
MTHRSQRSPQERQARSRLVQLLAEQPFVRGSLVARTRSCGKPTCRCQRGQKHHALYLAVNLRGQRVLLYIPRDLEATARQWVDNGRRIQQQLHQLSQLQLEQLLQQKSRLRETKRTRRQKSQEKTSS